MTRIPAPPEIQKVLDRHLAKDIAAYVARREPALKDQGQYVTVRMICKRFNLKQLEAQRIIEENFDVLALTSLAFRPAPEDAVTTQNWGALFSAAFLPKIWPDAPLAIRIVMVTEEYRNGEIS